MAADAVKAGLPDVGGFFPEGVVQTFARLRYDGFFTYLGFKRLRANHTAIEELAAHTVADARPQDRILCQGEVNAEDFVGGGGRKSHR